MRPISISANERADAGRLRGTLRSLSWPLVGAAVLLALIGVALVHSASAELAASYLPRQIAWLAMGLAVLGLGVLVDYQLLFRASVPLYFLGLAAVGFILVFGHEAGGARSWIGLGGLGGQPSDFTKLTTAILLARYLGSVRLEVLELRHLVVAGTILAIPVALIALQPDLGGAAMFAPLLVGMVFVAGVRLRLVAGILLVAVVLGSGLFFFGMQTYQRERILTFLQPERDPLGAGYQVRQSKIAVGSGATIGKGYMQGTQSQLRFLPARHTDFVFAVLAEEQGFVGVTGVLALYVVFLGTGLRIASRARDRSGILLACGLLTSLAAHVLYNTAMVIGLVPVTGIPLPFLSYGGSFMMFCFFSTGILLGIDVRRYVNRRAGI